MSCPRVIIKVKCKKDGIVRHHRLKTRLSGKGLESRDEFITTLDILKEELITKADEMIANDYIEDYSCIHTIMLGEALDSYMQPFGETK